MATISSLYDPDVIASILGEQSKANAATTTDDDDDSVDVSDFDKITQPELKVGANQQLFSAVFWKPKTIPDIPVPMFSKKDWPTEAQFAIPKANPNWIWNRPVLEQFALAMYCNDTTLLWGLQGTGKSDLAREWCAALTIPFWRMNCNRETSEGHFLGSPAVEYNTEGQMFIKQEPTTLTDSLKYGGLFCEDEAFRHSAALVLQSLREKNSRFLILPDAPGRTSEERKLTAPKNKWWYVLTDNTSGMGDETGLFNAEVQDASTLDRIDLAIEVKYLGKPAERQMLAKYTTLNKSIINGMLDVAKLVRNAFSNKAIQNTMSVRGLLSWAEKATIIGNLEEGFKLAWYNKLNSDDQTAVRDMYHQVFGRTL